MTSKNGQGHMRVKRGVVSSSPRCLSVVCCLSVPACVATKSTAGIFLPPPLVGGDRILVFPRYLPIAIFQRRNPRATRACRPPPPRYPWPLVSCWTMAVVSNRCSSASAMAAAKRGLGERCRPSFPSTESGREAMLNLDIAEDIHKCCRKRFPMSPCLKDLVRSSCGGGGREAAAGR